MKKPDVGPQIPSGELKHLGDALVIDAFSAVPLIGNLIRVALTDPLDVDYIEPKDVNDHLWALGTIASFIPVATIIQVKEIVKTRKAK